MLLENVKITTNFLDKFDENQIQINGGLEQVSDSRYLPEAYLPKRDFRQLSCLEKTTLLDHDTDVKPSETLALLTIPPDLVQNLINTGFYELDTVAAIRDYSLRTDYTEIVAPIIKFLESFVLERKNLRISALWASPSNQQSTAFDRKNNKFVGMHIDCYDRLPIDQIGRARNRIVVNLGKQSRYLDVVNLTACKVCELVKSNTGKDFRGSYQHPNLLREFVSCFPSYPSIRVEIKPLQAYIAPTENIIHDGSTQSSTEPDIYLPLIGYFKVT